jgi:septal ring factor EnvC (AmiA/AmiB activator)
LEKEREKTVQLENLLNNCKDQTNQLSATLKAYEILIEELNDEIEQQQKTINAKEARLGNFEVKFSFISRTC